jgi:hypothetical protein
MVEGEVRAVLSKGERAQIEQELATALAAQSNPQSLLRVIFLGQADSILLQLPSGVLPREIAFTAIQTCLESRWTFDPSLLQMLLEYLIDVRGVGAFDEILTRVRQRIDPNQSIYNAAWLVGRRPFFDRRDFRSRVQRMIEQNGWAILCVSAVAESFGRTYSRYFLQHLEDSSPSAVHVLYVGLSVGTGPSYQVLDLLEAVDSQLGAEDPIPARTGSSYPVSAALWMLKQIIKRPGCWLVVLDGFGQKELNPEVRATIEELAVRVPTGQYRLRIRLVLLDYPQELPNVSPADMLVEDLPLSDSIVRADLEPCLEAWDAERMQCGMAGMAAGELERLADGMLGRAPLTGKERLEVLNIELTKLYNF